MAEFFQRKQAEMLTVLPGQIRFDLPVNRRELVCELMSNRGQFLVAMKKNFNVNIVSPKSYSAVPIFTIIGEEVSDRISLPFAYSLSLISSFLFLLSVLLWPVSFCFLVLLFPYLADQCRSGC